MLGLIVAYALLWAALVFLLLGGTSWFQGIIYTEPAAGLIWRGPAAAAVLAAFFALWGYIDFKYPRRYVALHEFTTTEDSKYFPKLEAVKGGTTSAYTTAKDNNGRIYYRDHGGRQLPSRPDAIIVEEDGEKVRFEPERDKQGKLKVERGSSLLYRDARGRVMTEDYIGRLSLSHSGWLVGNLLLNSVHLLVWFVCLWLILQYTWPHSIGLAIVFWLIMTILILPMLLHKVEAVADERSAPQHATRVFDLTPRAPHQARGERYRMCMMSPSWTT